MFKTTLYTFLFLLTLGILFFSCNEEGASKKVYISGKVINPRYESLELNSWTSDFLLTTKLNTKKEFFFEIDSLKEGEYLLADLDEYQLIYLVPGDSISILFNTWNFDESFTFEGKGAKRNEILLHYFLENEKLTANSNHLMTFEIDRFEKYIDSIVRLRHKTKASLFKIKNEYKSKKLITTLEKNNILLYYLKELYILNNKLRIEDLPKSLTEHRQFIDVNTNKFLGNEFWFSYLYAFFSNMIIDNEVSNSDKHFIVLDQIHKQMKPSNTKHMLASEIILKDFYEDSTFTVSQKNIDLFKSIKVPDTVYYIRDVNQTLEKRYILKKNQKIPNFDVVKKDTTSLYDVFNEKNKIVLTFWTSTSLLEDMLFIRIEELKRKFPNYQFVVLDLTGTQKNIGIAEKSNFKNYYLIKDTKQIDSFIDLSNIRTLILDKNGQISNEFTNILSDFIEDQL